MRTNLTNRAMALTIYVAIFLSFVFHQAIFPAWSDDLNPNDEISYVEDGELSQQLHLPTYEWYPKSSALSGSILAIHGLTLHAKRYEVVCKTFAASGFYTCAFDMRGFGRCYADERHTFCIGNDCKKKVDYDKSYAEAVQVARFIKQKHGSLPLYVMGESLGTSMCIKLAGEHPELVDGLILSGPTVQVHPLMFVHPKVIAAATVGYFMQPRFEVNTDAFVKYLVSNDPNVPRELLDDPLCRKGLTIRELLKTGEFVAQTITYARKIKRNEPVLVLQGSADRCMVPQAIVRLSKNIQSSDQTLRWLHAYGHLLLETVYLRPSVVEAVANWLDDQNPARVQRAHSTQARILQLGAKACSDNF